MKSVFVTVVELKPLTGCEIDPDEYHGVSVRCYIPASNENDARKAFGSALKEYKFDLVAEEFFVQHDLVEWESPESEEANAAISEALDSEVVVFSEMKGWGHDDPDAH